MIPETTFTDPILKNIIEQKITMFRFEIAMINQIAQQYGTHKKWNSSGQL